MRLATVGVVPSRRADGRATPVVHMSHPAFGYLISDGRHRVAWAPEFWGFPERDVGVDLVFAEAASWKIDD